MVISFLGHASFRIKTRTASLVTDPYDPAMLSIPFPKISADIVTVSHDHNDHNKTDLIKNTRKIVNGPGEYEILDISIIGLPTYHDDKKGQLRGKNTVYIIEAEGIRLSHLGDLGHKLGEEELTQMGEIDVLMIPVGGEYTIGPVDAASVVTSVEPKIVIPMHYKYPGISQDTFGKLSDAADFLKELGWGVEEVDKLTLKGILTDEHKVVKMKPING